MSIFSGKSAVSSAAAVVVEALESRQLFTAMGLDVRQLGSAWGSGKSIAVAENGTFTLGIYLRSIDGAASVSPQALNGLGAYGMGLRSYQESTHGGAVAWPVSPTPSDTVVNVESTVNSQSSTIFDAGFSNGVLRDIPASPILGFEIDPDSDTDYTGLGGIQNDGGSPTSYTTGIAVNKQVLLGTVTYRATDLSESTRPQNRTVSINAYYTNAGGGFGGAVIRGLVNNATDNTNQVGDTNLIFTQGQIGAPVVVTVGVTTATISGRAFDDRNADGLFNGTDVGVQGFRVYLDKDFDAVLDSDEISKPVSTTGTYTFTGVVPGTYRVREVVRTGWRQTIPASGYYEISIAAGQTAKTISFANTQNILIKGFVWHDSDKDKVKDSIEGGLPGWSVYADLNTNGIFDGSDVLTTTDHKGEYRFTTLRGGTYQIRVIQNSNYRQTAPGSGFHTVTLADATSISNRNFGEKRL